MLRGVEIQAQDIRGFFFKVGIVGAHVPLQAMRLQPGPPPHAGDQDVADPEHLANFRVLQCVLPSGGRCRVFAKMRASIAGGGPPHGRRLPAAPGPQPREPGGLEAPLPAVDVVRVTPEGRGDRRKRLPCREHQNDPRAPRVFGAALAPPDPSLQFGAFIRVQHQRHMALQYTTTDSVGTGH